MVNFMQIDARRLNEVIPKMARRKIKNERFYAVPNAKGYALSDYGRLVYGNKWVPLVRKKNNEIYCDYYRIKFDDNDTKILVRVDKLVAMVFRPNEKIYCLVNLRWLNGKNKNRRDPNGFKLLCYSNSIVDTGYIYHLFSLNQALP